MAVLLLAGVGYYFGIQRPAEKRKAEEQARLIAEQESTARTQQQARERAEQEARERAEKAAAEAKAKTEREQDEYTAILATIAAVHDDAPRTEFEAMERVTQEYLAKAPEQFQTGAQQALDRRRTAWAAYEAAHRPGSLIVETDPAGATVTLYPRNERKTSPAQFKDIKPGEVSFRVEKDGYEPQDFPYTIKPGAEHRADRVQLLATTGSVAITSEPAGAKVSVDGNSRHFEGVTPFKQAQIPPGDYRVTFQRENWRPVTQNLTVKRNAEATLAANLRGIALAIRSTPAGAYVAINGHGVGVTPLNLTDQPPGDYKLALALEGYDMADRSFTAESDTTLDIPLTKGVPQIGTLVIYRESHFVGVVNSPDLRIDGQLVAAIGSGTFFTIDLPVGEHDISVKAFGASPIGTQINLHAGKTIYLAMEITMTGFSVHPSSESVARPIIAKLRPAKRAAAKAGQGEK